MDKIKLIFALFLLLAHTSAQQINEEKKSKVLACMFLVRLISEKEQIADQMLQTKGLVNCYLKITNPQVSEVSMILQRRQSIDSLTEGIRNLVVGKAVEDISEDLIQAHSNEINLAIQQAQGDLSNNNKYAGTTEAFTNLGIVGVILNFFVRISQVIVGFFVSALGFNIFVILLYFILRGFAQSYRDLKNYRLGKSNSAEN